MPKGERFKFINLETPKADLDFYFAGKLWRIEDGRDYPDVYDHGLQKWMSEHLNNLMVNEYSAEIEPNSGQLINKLIGARPRFMAQVFKPVKKPVPMSEALGTVSKKEPKEE